MKNGWLDLRKLDRFEKISPKIPPLSGQMGLGGDNKRQVPPIDCYQAFSNIKDVYTSKNHYEA